jgi:hypothetical protein
MTHTHIILLLVAVLLSACAETPTHTTRLSSNDEPAAPQAISPVQKWNELSSGLQLSWGSSNQRYHREYIPEIPALDEFTCTAWQNERVYAQLVAWSKDSVPGLSIQVSDLESPNGTIPASAIRHYYVRNVIADEFLGGCGYKTKKQETAHLVADCLEEADIYSMQAKSTRGIWFNIDVPASASAGKYTADITVRGAGKKVKKLTLNIEVLNQQLPSSEDWSYHLDLWQNPYAVARMHDVALWSKQHFELMTPLYQMLAEAGQKCITASIVHKPWGGQTYDPFESMIKHTLNADGSWEFDYSLFDQWVDFMLKLGINRQINCYSLIPWGNQLGYFDEKLGRDTFLLAEATSKEFAGYWIPFLKDFKTHLKERGLYDITTVAMDERPMKDMLSAIDLITEHSGLKITSAANYDPGMSGQVYDLSVESKHILPQEILDQRREKGQKTTFYVCCSAEYPNNFTYSPPAEGVWQGWYAYAKNLDGFLRWAYNSWVEDPMVDTRFRTWPAGDTFFVYPGAKSSIRFEKLREGIQDFEKLRILTAQLQASDSPEAQQHLTEIEQVLAEFEVESIGKTGALSLVEKAQALLNKNAY